MRKVVRLKHCQLSRNNYFVVGVLVGLCATLFIPEDAWTIAQKECPAAVVALQHQADLANAGIGGSHDDGGDAFEPRLNLVNKPMAAKKVVRNIVRPRYYSSELGIREKLFVGVMTSQENINTLATAFNRTTAHLVNKIKYFINADNVKSNFRLKNIVGFTDTRENMRPFHVLKYIADNYLNDFDYFMLTTDEVYVDARRLMEKLYHISISYDVYMGTRVTGDGADHLLDEKKVCDIQSAIVLSSSVIRKIRANLDWCVRNAVTSFHSFNIGKCVMYSTKLTECQQSFQGISLGSYKLNTHRIYRDLILLRTEPSFNAATFLYPATRTEDIYTLHTYFSRLHLEEIKSRSVRLERNAYNISNGTISNDILEIKWPLGVPKSRTPETRHDILPWTMFNLTHQFMPDHELNTVALSHSDAEDLRKVMNRTVLHTIKEQPNLVFVDLHSAYRRFDPVRGMDYQLHLNWLDANRNERLLKSYEIVKPLGHVEIVQSPYVTESTRVSLMLPVFEQQVDDSVEFVKRYNNTCLANKDNTFLLLVFLYRSDSSNKGKDDVFNKLKELSLQLSELYKTDGPRIAWLSIRLPDAVPTARPDDIMLSSIFARNEILSLVVTDLALSKIGLDLVMMCSNAMNFKSDFLNRVRMNTIQGFQVFSPIGFVMYPCNLANFCKVCDSCDVSQASGYFDRHNHDVIAFYGRDYVDARKSIQAAVPIVRSDNDIVGILERADMSINNILDMFIASNVTLHLLRAIEPNLRLGAAIRTHLTHTKVIPSCPYWDTALSNRCIHLASRKQIGDALVKYEDRAVNNP